MYLLDNLKNKISSLFKKGFIDIVGSNMLNNIFLFISNMILVRILTKSEYGLFTYVWNIYYIVMLACGIGLESGFLQLASEKPNDESFHSKMYGFCIKWGSFFNIGIAVVLSAIAIIVTLKNKELNILLFLISFLPIFQFFYRMILARLRACKRNRDYAKITNINTICVAVFTVAGALAFREFGLVIGHYIAAILTLIIAKRVVKYSFDQTIIESRDVKKSLISISFISVLNNGMNQLLYTIDVFLIGLLISSELILASYKVATQIPNAMRFIPQVTVIFIYPYFAEHRLDKDWCKKAYKKLMIPFTLAILFVTIILLVLAPLVISIVYGDKYLDAVPVFRVLTIGFLISAPFRTITVNLLLTQRKIKFNFIVSIITGIINVIGNILLIPVLGALGAAYVTVFVIIISSLISTVYLLKCFDYLNINKNNV